MRESLIARFKGVTFNERATQVYILDQSRGKVLLIRRRGMGTGVICGAGDKIEGSETPAECARRELAEETGPRGYLSRTCALWAGFGYT